MELRPIKSNMTEIVTNDGLRVLFSYQTPVAAIKPTGEQLHTAKKWSKTTTSHIRQYFELMGLQKDNSKPAPQEWFDGLKVSL